MGIFTTSAEINFEVKLVEGKNKKKKDFLINIFYIKGRDSNGEILATKMITNSRSSGDI